MGCSISGLNSMYDAANAGGDVWINENRYRIIRKLGEGGFAFVFLVKEIITNTSSHHVDVAVIKKSNKSSYISDDGTYAMKKVLIQSDEQLALVKEEIHNSSLFSHYNLLPLLDHAIISVKPTAEHTWKHEAYLLFPVHLDGTLFDIAKAMKAKKEFFSTSDVLQIFRQSPLAVLMDFGSARLARRQICSRSEALQLQEWAAEHCSAPYRSPKLWDCPSQADLNERTDIWSLGCTLYALMYGESPFEYALGESGGSLQLAIVNVQIKWPAGPSPPYPEALHQFVTWMLQPQASIRPCIDDIIVHVDKLVSKFSQ